MTTQRAEQGSALIEFSLIAPIVILMVMGVVDLSLVIQRQMTITEAAHVGAEYGTILGNGSDFTGMQNAATSAAGGLSGFAVLATHWCTCTPGSGTVSCSSTCTTNLTPIQYVQVNTTLAVSVLVSYPGIPGSFALQGQSIMRVP